MRRAALLVLLGASLLNDAAAGEHEDLAKLRKRIAALQQELEKSSESRSDAADALRESEQAISEARRKLGDLSRQQQQAQGELARLQAQSARLKVEVQGLQEKLAALLYREYLAGQQEYPELILNNRDPNQAARDLRYYGYVARSQAAWLNRLRGNLQQLGALAEQARLKDREINALQQDAAIQERALEQDRAGRQQILQKIAARIRQQNREIGRLQRNENRLSQLIARLPQMADPASRGPFEALRGKLALPIKGRPSNRFGARRPDGTVAWKGWFFRAPVGQEVKAVAAGQVVFADWLRGFGNLLIVDHGKGYMSLYGNNETLYKQVGDALHRGDVIAAAGSSGGNEDSGLYFELRHEGKPLDPARWVATK